LAYPIHRRLANVADVSKLSVEISNAPPQNPLGAEADCAAKGVEAVQADTF